MADVQCYQVTQHKTKQKFPEKQLKNSKHNYFVTNRHILSILVLQQNSHNELARQKKNSEPKTINRNEGPSQGGLLSYKIEFTVFANHLLEPANCILPIFCLKAALAHKWITSISALQIEVAATNQKVGQLQFST